LEVCALTNPIPRGYASADHLKRFSLRVEFREPPFDLVAGERSEGLKGIDGSCAGRGHAL